VPKLATILWIDSQFEGLQESAIVESLGDRYLLSLNPIFATIRILAISCGGQFSSSPTAMWMDYRNAPLFCLQQIIQSRTIPYVANKETIERIVLANPGAEISDASFPGLVQKNVVLHESAHLCSDQILTMQFSPSGEKSDFVVRSLIAESFANLVESLANAFAGPTLHRLFLSMNSYQSMSANRAEILRTALLTAGIGNVMRLGMVVYLFLNSHSYAPPSEFVRKAVGLANSAGTLSRAEIQILKSLVESVFLLNEKFRTETTPLFFSLHHSLPEFESFSKSFVDPSALGADIIQMLDFVIEAAFPLETQDRYLDVLQRIA
jgi:hypothetical protein